MSARPRAVLLDVDGTLLDTNHLHALAWSRALRRHHIDVPMVDIHRLIGMGSDQLVDELLPDGAPDGLGDEEQDEFQKLRPDVRRLPGAQELIRLLDGAGVQVVLASSSPKDQLEFFREVIDADDHITAATSADDADASKPAPDILLAALAEVGVAPEDAVLVGDTVWDVEAARKAGIDVIAVLTGAIPREDLLAAGAAAVYDSVATLADDLDQSPLARLLS